jgi:hypothetical protein
LNTKVSPVQKVVTLLDELKAKVQADLVAEEKLMDEYTTWCDEEANMKEDAITSAKRTIVIWRRRSRTRRRASWS